MPALIVGQFRMVGLLLLTVFFYFASASATRGYCSEQEEQKTPCDCCKVRCWYNIQQQAHKTLGHIPGTQGETEAIETLKAIAKCIRTFCPEVCPSKGRPVNDPLSG